MIIDPGKRLLKNSITIGQRALGLHTHSGILVLLGRIMTLVVAAASRDGWPLLLQPVLTWLGGVGKS